jgi:hypothetical protein
MAGLLCLCSMDVDDAISRIDLSGQDQVEDRKVRKIGRNRREEVTETGNERTASFANSKTLALAIGDITSQ